VRVLAFVEAARLAFDAFCLAMVQTPATLVLAGNSAADDPEGPAMYESICARSGERIIVTLPMIHCSSTPFTRAALVLQKSLREGFGLTVSEAMWKGRAVIRGDVGGIRHQIEHGRSGFLVADVEEAARYIGLLLSDVTLRRRLGRRARERAQAFPDDAAARGLARLDHLACAAKVRTNFHTGTGGRRVAFGRQGKISVRLFSCASLKSRRSPKACLPSSMVAPSALSPG
jgi:Glycosyl transferases group 1